MTRCQYCGEDVNFGNDKHNYYIKYPGNILSITYCTVKKEPKSATPQGGE